MAAHAATSPRAILASGRGKAVSDIDLPIAALLDTCLAENDRRMAGYDRRLLRPMAVPRLVRLARKFMRTPRPAAA